MMQSGFYNMDCMAGMAQFPDGYFDIAVVDPPYGNGGTPDNDSGKIRGGGCDFSSRERGRFGGRFDRYYIGQSCDKKCGHWDIAPPPEYFSELARVSKNQIIWGGNYFDLPPTRCFLVWRKLTISEKFSMAMCEYAWTSFNDNAKWIELPPQGRAGQERFHPTQKPIALYSWILNNYAKPNDKILDTHVGSASSLIACHRAGLEYWGFELDAEYFKKSK